MIRGRGIISTLYLRTWLHPSRAPSRCRWLLICSRPSSSPSQLLPRPTHTTPDIPPFWSGQKAQPRQRAHVHKSYIPPIDRVPPPDIPVHPRAQTLNAVQMSRICDQQRYNHCSPDNYVVSSGAQHQCLVDGKEGIEIGELGEYYGG